MHWSSCCSIKKSTYCVWMRCCIFPCTGVHVAASLNPHNYKTKCLPVHLCSVPKAARTVIYCFARFKATFNCTAGFCYSAAAWAGCTAKPLSCSCLACRGPAYCCPAAAIGQWILCSLAAPAGLLLQPGSQHYRTFLILVLFVIGTLQMVPNSYISFFSKFPI